MVKNFEIHRVTSLPSTGVNGDWYILKNGTRHEIYVVQSDGSLLFNKGITDDENARLTRLDNIQLSKLEGLNTQIQIDDKINLISSGIEGIIKLSDPTPIVDGVYELSEVGTYAQLGGIVSEAGYTTKVERKTTGGITTWKIFNKVSGALAVGKILPSDTNAISGKTAYQNNLIINENLKEIIGEESKIFEIGDISTFNTPINLSQGTVILDRKFTGLEVISITVNVITAGVMVFGSYSINANVASRVGFITKTLEIGLNTFVYQPVEGSYFGFSFNTGGNLSRIGAENDTASYGHWAENVNISTGTTLGTKRFNQRIGVSIKVIATESLKKEVAEAIKESDLTISSENIFDINNHVLPGFVVVNTGAVLPNATWSVARIPISDIIGQKLNWGHCTSPRTSHFAIFATANNVMLEGTLPINFSYLTGGGNGIVPDGAEFILINIKSPDDLPSVYDTLMVNTGLTLESFKPYKPEVSEIKGIPLKSTSDGGEAYDQPLNTFNEVIFASVKTPILDVIAFKTEAPIWDETGVAPIDVGYEYLFPLSAIAYQRRVRRS